MNEQVQDKIFNYIDAIGEKLGVASEYILTAIHRQMIIDGIIWTILTIVLILCLIVGAKALYAKFNEEQEYNKDKRYYSEQKEFYTTFFVAYSIIGSIVTVSLILFLPTHIMKIFNPDYYTVKMILSGLVSKI